MKNVKLLITRTDRLGDVLMSLPTLSYVRENLPEAEIDFLIQDIYVPVLEPFLKAIRVNPIKEVLSYKTYTHLLSLYSERDIVWNAFRAKVKYRVGIYSKPWSFFLLTNGIRQKRSQALKSEAEYNLDLGQLLLKEILQKTISYTKPNLEIPIDPIAQKTAMDYLKLIELEKEFVLFHPGMRGSALNLNPLQYLDLIDRAEKQWGYPIALSIGPVQRDREIAETILGAKPYLKIVQNVEITVLREIFRLAKIVVAPSTGPLHLAHYVGTRTIGLYPPVKTQSAMRWAPWGGSGLSSVYFPEVKCPGKVNCLGTSCESYLCMETFDWAKTIYKSSP